ncbi:MAG: 3-methyl-2-oxobutanoate hydroxymethyltransferase [Chromatiales bacterium]
MGQDAVRKKVSITRLRDMKATGVKIACLTAYDATFGRVLDEAGVDVILIGDSLGMVMQGHDSTLPVTVADMIYHAANVRRSVDRAMLMTDMPYMSYATPEQALSTAARLMSEGRAQMVKLEGGGWVADTVRLLTERGIPVCGHLGLQPQSIHRLGGYRVQGRDTDSARAIKEDAHVLEAAGAVMLILECVPRALAAELSGTLSVPVIGIGAGADCDGQILVLHDMLGIGFAHKFTRDFMIGSGSIPEAIGNYVRAVKAKSFPALEHGFD